MDYRLSEECVPKGNGATFAGAYTHGGWSSQQNLLFVTKGLELEEGA